MNTPTPDRLGNDPITADQFAGYAAQVIADADTEVESIFSLMYFLDDAAYERLSDTFDGDLYDGVLDTIPESQLATRTQLTDTDVYNARVRRHLPLMKLAAYAAALETDLEKVAEGINPVWDDTILPCIYPSLSADLPLVRLLQNSVKLARRLAARYVNGDRFPARCTAENMVLYAAVTSSDNDLSNVVAAASASLEDYLFYNYDFTWWYDTVGENVDKEEVVDFDGTFYPMMGEDSESDFVAVDPELWFRDTQH